MSGTFYADRSERGKLRFSGPQDRWFLHQILTQAFEDMQPGEARDSAMITAHGRMVGYLEVLATEDGLLAHFEPELKADLPDAIRRYVFATQVEIEDVSDDVEPHPGWRYRRERSRRSWRGTHPPDHCSGRARVLRVDEIAPTTSSRYSATRGPSPPAKSSWRRSVSRTESRGGAVTWTPRRSLRKRASTERAVHFDKGCYVGQEAMAKIHFRGKVNRTARAISSEGRVEDGVELQLDGQPALAWSRARPVCRDSRWSSYTVEPGATLTAGDREVAVVG